MPRTYKYLLHSSRVLWPEYRNLDQVLELQRTTPEDIWESGYQGNPTAQGGTIFDRNWWSPVAHRWDASDAGMVISQQSCIARYISWDTALKDKAINAWTACTVGELYADYRLAIREVWRAKVPSSDLVTHIEAMASKYNRDGKLRGVLVEDKASGITAIQTMQLNSPAWLRDLLIPFQPPYGKEDRANMITIYCKNSCVLLPTPTHNVPWLHDFTEELYAFPGSAAKDQVDSFTQLLLYLEHFLAEGDRLRRGV